MNCHSLPADHARLLAFLARWYPYGGGDSRDIFVEFGLTDMEYFVRVFAVLTQRSLTASLDDHTRHAMKDVCTARITQARRDMRAQSTA